MGVFSTTTTLDTVMVGVTFNTATTSVATECITWSEDEIRKYLSKRYDMSSAQFQTSTSTPPMVKTWATRMACGYLEMQISRGGTEALKRGQDKVDSVIDNLKLVKSGALDVLNTAGSSLTEGANSAFKIDSNASGYEQTFNVDDPLDWEVDSDRLNDIEDDRD